MNTVISKMLRRYAMYWLRFRYSLLFELVCVFGRVFKTDSLLPRDADGISESGVKRSRVLT